MSRAPIWKPTNEIRREKIDLGGAYGFQITQKWVYKCGEDILETEWRKLELVECKYQKIR